jgi:1-pyrroline-5-carboxylate dehydrogenase
MWKTIGNNIADYRSYPRIVGETGGKDFIFIHPSYTDTQALATAITRGAFEYQGQKCSAASRAYVPKSLWADLKTVLVEMVKSIKMGDVEDFTNFMGAVIDGAAFDKHREYLEFAKSDGDHEVIAGGECNDDEGFFVSPTVVQSKKPQSKLMEEEIFGPVMTIYVYDDAKFEETLQVCDRTSPYALTGCIWATDRKAVMKAFELMHHAAGNFYINDKPTAAVVGQQPFGGSRASGTNDKAGSLLNLIRWTSPQTRKELLVPPSNYIYPSMLEE